MLRPVEIGDHSRVRVWRNHPDVRERMFTQHEIGEGEHAQWFRELLLDEDRQGLIFEFGEEPSGFLAFRGVQVGDGHLWWETMVLDIGGLQERGQLIPAWLTVEREAVRFAFDELGAQTVRGEVLASNRAVIDLHRRHGFEVSDPARREHGGQEFAVVSIELRAEDHGCRRRS